MTKIGLLGDVHGNTPWGRFAVAAFSALGIEDVIQVGDFGLYTGRDGQKFLSAVSEQAQKRGVTLWVVPGNHENWDFIAKTVEDSDSWASVRQNIYVAPRVNRWEWEGVSFASLSGAPSVDRQWRLRANESLPAWYAGDKHWYEAECFTQADVDALAAGGQAHVMIAHDAPNGIRTISENIDGNPHGFASEDLEYAGSARALMDEAFAAVSPEVFVHGHYHFKVDEKIPKPGSEQYEWMRTHVVGLNRDTFPDSLAVLDLETGVAEFVNHTALLQAYLKGKL